MSVRTKIAGVTFCIGVVATSLMVSSPASAAQSDCAAGYACNWIDAGWVGFLTPFQYSISDYRNYSMNDRASSVYNNGNVSNVRMYADINYGGTYVTLPIKTGDGDLSNNVGYISSGWNDRFSSGKFI